MSQNGYDGAGVTCPHCGRAAEFHSHRPHTPFSLVGAVRYRRAYDLCRCCGRGLFPFDRDAGLTTRGLTPALERVAGLAGAVADSFEKGADLLEEMGGVRVSESTVARTTEDAGRRLAGAVAAGATFGPRLRREEVRLRRTRRHRGETAGRRGRPRRGSHGLRGEGL